MARVGRARLPGGTMSRKHRLTDEQRDQRRAEDRERLKQAPEQLLTSEGWKRWVLVRAQGRPVAAVGSYLVERRCR